MNGIWDKENNRDISNKVLLFLISPFFSLVYSLRSLNRKSSFWVIFGFCVFWGLAFTVGTERYENSGDGITYRAMFERYRTVSVDEFMFDLKEYLKFDEGAKDFYADTVSFLVSRVTGNYHVLFMVYAIIFAFFQLKCLKFFISANKYKTLTFYVFCLLAMFTLNQIFNINGVRFWTAAWIAVYSVLQIFYNGKNSYLVLLAFTPFVHGSYFLFVFAVVIALLTKGLKKVWTVLFVLSFAFSTIAVDVFNTAVNYLPTFMVNQAEAYLDAWTISEVNNRVGTGFWVVGKVFASLEKIYMNLLVLLLIINRNRLEGSKSDNLLGALLVMISMANFTMPVPSVGVRFIRLTFPLIALLFLQNMPEKKYRYLIIAFPFIFIFTFYYLVLNYLEVVGPTFFISSPIYIIIKDLLLV